MVDSTVSTLTVSTIEVLGLGWLSGLLDGTRLVSTLLLGVVGSRCGQNRLQLLMFLTHLLGATTTMTMI
jgi:hypothetical protein